MVKGFFLGGGGSVIAVDWFEEEKKLFGFKWNNDRNIEKKYL